VQALSARSFAAACVLEIVLERMEVSFAIGLREDDIGAVAAALSDAGGPGAF
jgi:hypothetical protein